MRTIGILGASGQVGASVALYLKKFSGIETICFIRSSYSTIFFDLYNIPFQHIDFENEFLLKEKIGSLDVILDFRYPAGQLHQILSESKKNISRILSVMKKGSKYFYMSSIMAYGMPDNEKRIANYYLPRTSYSYIKRKIERFVVSKGGQEDVQIYNFRLGQVHGFLQSVNASFRKKLAEKNIALIDGAPGDLVNIIFVYPLCEAIIHCANDKCKPGLYTLVASPQWSLQDLYEYYIQYYNRKAHLEFVQQKSKNKRKSLLQHTIDFAKPYRSLVETYILMNFPSMSTRIKGSFRKNELINSRNILIGKQEFIDFNLLGTPGISLIPGLTTEPLKIMQIEKEMEAFYNQVIESKSR